MAVRIFPEEGLRHLGKHRLQWQDQEGYYCHCFFVALHQGRHYRGLLRLPAVHCSVQHNEEGDYHDYSFVPHLQ
jgi:hypothetical protein